MAMQMMCSVPHSCWYFDQGIALRSGQRRMPSS
jgi:hypothetical protein